MGLVGDPPAPVPFARQVWMARVDRAARVAKRHRGADHGPAQMGLLFQETTPALSAATIKDGTNSLCWADTSIRPYHTLAFVIPANVGEIS
jgi:hypothetical protein